MTSDKAKCCEQESSEVDGFVKTAYSVLVASAASLASSVLSTTSSHEMLGNIMDSLVPLNKAQLSSSSPTSNSPLNESKVGIFPKPSQSRYFHSLLPGHNEHYGDETKQEYYRILSDNSFEHSQFSYSKKNPKIHTRHQVMQKQMNQLAPVLKNGSAVMEKQLLTI
ncbi:hypothetical protein EV44_g3250 [Erysiphe necator]|uniref:Uncharacterized protein n=1 Tax=Uncinula necator TaxID=52586 RepID=A0A0B1PA83_UNCNE|nr:hypothetical protein EV44_g3250 [Erysiphe necator]